MVSSNVLALFLLLSSFLELSFQGGVIKFTPPAKINCKDDEDMAKNCPEWKNKGFCESKRSLMEAACSETCGYCSEEKFSKKIEDIIKDQQVIEKVTGDLEKTEEGLEQGNASPSSQGSFQGNGKSAAEQEATEVPNGPDNNEVGKKPPGTPDEPQTTGNQGEGGKQGEKPGNEVEKPGNEVEKPGKEGRKPANEGEKPLKEGEKPLKEGEKPLKEGEKPLKEGEKPGKGGGKGSEPDQAPQASGKVGATGGCDQACQKECIDTHNKYRANHGAEPLTFDQTLADQAQAHADKVAAEGQFKHSDWAAGKGGECIGWGWVKPSWTIAVKDWHDEEKDYDYGTGKSKNGKAIGHFTQVVWKKAKKAGCGKSMMNDAPFYITQMDVVGIVTDTLPGYEKENVGQPKKPDIDWFNDLRDKQMKELGYKRDKVISGGWQLIKSGSKVHHRKSVAKRTETSTKHQHSKVKISVNGRMKEKHQLVEDN